MLFNTGKKILGYCSWLFPKKVQLSALTMLLTFAVAHSAYAIPDQAPLFLANPVKPIMMLNMSNDHQLFFKVYDDYGDLTDPAGGEPDGIPDTTYVPKYDYYGYFDSAKCYTYSTSNGRFEPKDAADTDHYCTPGDNEWSGNFLNWSTMTRVDAVRKILYGGLRQTDSSTVTVLERAFLPHDAHSFAKFYDGNDIHKLTPFSSSVAPQLQTTLVDGIAEPSKDSGITLCNTTPAPSTMLSQNVNTPPVIRVVKGNYSLWASNERYQCKWASEVSGGDGVNGNTSESKIYAYATSPVDGHKLTVSSLPVAGQYNLRVQVCVSGKLESNCQLYPSGINKPVGLLQEYGETDKIHFGLMTGSYGKNKSGGMLRKTVGNMLSEIKTTTTGEFNTVSGIITTLNKLRIYGYRYSDGLYTGGTGSDNCPFDKAGYVNGSCTNWGNPQSEIYLESLRYLVGDSVNSNFSSTTENSYISGLAPIDWGTDPVTSANYCAPLSVIQFNASSSSFDDDELSGSSSIGLADVSVWTDKIALDTHENFTGSFFVGLNGGTTSAETDEVCTAKPLLGLSKVKGTCPDAPRLKGSYGIAGLAYYARQNDIMSLTGTQTVRTYGVALAPAVPSVTIPVPNSDKKVTLLPSCKNINTSTAIAGLIGTQPVQREGNCALVDFKIVSLSVGAGNTNTASLYVNWEAAESGGDYDQDMWGVINISVEEDSDVIVETDVIQQSSGRRLAFGYVISGTNRDGFHAHSGINGFNQDGCAAVTGGCVTAAAATDEDYKAGTSLESLLPTPLALAAKWGGYSDAFVKATKKQAQSEGATYSDDYLASKIKDRDTSDTYYYATDPRTLETSLAKAFSNVAASVGSAASVATNSTRFSEGSFVYQAQFNSEDWTGALYAYEFDSNGNIDEEPSHCTKSIIGDGGVVECSGVMQTSDSGRNIYTYNGSNRVNFSWANLTDPQKIALRLSPETTDDNAIKRVDWLLGNATHEGTGGMRERGTGSDRNILGDIVNSSPAYVGVSDFRYHKLPGAAGAEYREFVEDKKDRTPRIFVGANDGMVHAFNAETLVEEFAYIPGIAFPKLANLTDPDYGTSANPHQYIVDGPLAVGDVFINNEWRTIVVGTLGAGGKGIYALDVTDDTPKVLFELNETHYPQMGYVMGRPSIVAMKNGRWAAIFGNGDSSGYSSRLFIIDIESPTSSTYSKVLDTGAGTGLSAPALLPNAKGQIERAYVGDINGNLWRFDLSGDSAGDWEMEYKVFTAKDDDGNPQPITAAPTLGINSSKGEGTVMAYFGTGKYYDTGDNAASTIPQHSFYAVADIGSVVARNTLLEKTMATTYGTDPERIVNEANPDWESQNGWYLNFDDSGAIGERVTTKALLLQDYLVFVTLIPSDHACENGGNSWLMQLRAVGNKNVNGQPPLGPDGEGNVLNDFLVLGNPSFGELIPDPNSTGGGGPKDCPEGSRPGSVLVSGTDGSTKSTKVCLQSEPTGRQSWRQIR